MSTLLVVDDDRSVLWMIEAAFEKTDVSVLTAKTGEDALKLIRERAPDVVLLDILLPKAQGLDVFQEIKTLDARLPVIFITAGGTSDTAIEAMSLGAYDYLLKPLDLAQVRKLVHRALDIRRMAELPPEEKNTVPDVDPDSESIVGRSPKMQEVYKAIGRVATQDVIVLIRGESGTGKELVARAIYQHSVRAKKQFLEVNCAAIPESLLESELFGHEKGSFTGADQRRIGKFEQCSGGTLFLDEVGDMSPLIQSKLLRVLQEQRFERVGGNTTLETDVRIIAATNRDLEKMVEAGHFRQDLYYRLNGFTIMLPPLRDRGDDLQLLLEHFLSVYRREFHKDVHAFSEDALQLLKRYPWPGNVRELQGVLKQSLLQMAGPIIVPEYLPEIIREFGVRAEHPASSGGGTAGDLRPFVEGHLVAGSHNLYAETQEAMERYLLTRVLQLTEGNQSRAAAILGITRGCLRSKIRGLKIAISTSVGVHEPADPSDPDDETVAVGAAV